MAVTYEPLFSTTVSGTSTTVISFNSFSGYTDLVLISSIQVSNAQEDVYIEYNGGGTFSSTIIRGNGSTAASYRHTYGDISDNTPSSNDFAVCQTHIMNYANTTTYKTTLSRWGNATYATGAAVALNRANTNAITSMDIKSTGTGTYFKAGSTFTLYGIKSA